MYIRSSVSYMGSICGAFSNNIVGCVFGQLVHTKKLEIISPLKPAQLTINSCIRHHQTPKVLASVLFQIWFLKPNITQSRVSWTVISSPDLCVYVFEACVCCMSINISLLSSWETLFTPKDIPSEKKRKRENIFWENADVCKNRPVMLNAFKGGEIVEYWVARSDAAAVAADTRSRGIVSKYFPENTFLVFPTTLSNLEKCIPDSRFCTIVAKHFGHTQFEIEKCWILPLAHKLALALAQKLFNNAPEEAPPISHAWVDIKEFRVFASFVRRPILNLHSQAVQLICFVKKCTFEPCMWQV